MGEIKRIRGSTAKLCSGQIHGGWAVKLRPEWKRSLPENTQQETSAFRRVAKKISLGIETLRGEKPSKKGQKKSIKSQNVEVFYLGGPHGGRKCQWGRGRRLDMEGDVIPNPPRGKERGSGKKGKLKVCGAGVYSWFAQDEAYT